MSELPERPLRITADDINCVPEAENGQKNIAGIAIAPATGGKSSAGWIVGGALAACTMAAVVVFMALPDAPKEAVLPSPVTTNASASALTLSMMKLTVVTLHGRWTEDDGPLLAGDQESWTGSAVIVAGVSGTRPECIYALTNSHCLALESLACADKDGVPEVKDYVIDIVFPSGLTRRVTRMADTKNSGLDLAMLEIEAGDLREGVDFVAAPIPNAHSGRETDLVVALGSPGIGGGEVLSGTFTTGVISAFRSFAPGSGGEKYSVIQHTAAINPGNSGGALFLKSGNEQYVLLGINTFVMKDLQGVGFALEVAEAVASRTQYLWVTCDAMGAVELMHMGYNERATTVP